jgi:hypothetical protein
MNGIPSVSDIIFLVLVCFVLPLSDLEAVSASVPLAQTPLTQVEPEHLSRLTLRSPTSSQWINPQVKSRGKVGRFLANATSQLSRKGKGSNPRRGKGYGLGVASLVLGIVGVISFGSLIPSLLALIFGAISLKRYREGYHDSKGIAKAGLILGIIGVAFSVIYIGLFLAILLSGV